LNEKIFWQFKIILKYTGEELPQNFNQYWLSSARENFVLVKNRTRAWEFPGGHREDGETPIDTARREAFEEAGVHIAEIDVRGYYILANGHTTIVTTASIDRLPAPGELCNETSDVAVFPVLPAELSFKDGLYDRLIHQI
jgi:8-oxo-dGTP diphosphatase